LGCIDAYHPAMFSLSYVALAAGIVLLAGAALILWRRPSENSSLTGMFLAGVALIVLADPHLLSMKVGTSGFEVSRESFKDEQEEVRAQLGSLRAEIQRQKEVIAEHQRLIEARASSPQPASEAKEQAREVAVAERTTQEVQQINQRFAENSKYLVLVFYRGNRQAAEALAAALVREGYRSSTIPSDLTEISVPGIFGTPPPKTVVVARARNVDTAIATRVGQVAAAIDPKYELKQPIVNGDEWPFKRGDVQVYLF
jgi:hypothetical protein